MSEYHRFDPFSNYSSFTQITKYCGCIIRTIIHLNGEEELQRIPCFSCEKEEKEENNVSSDPTP
jgi:hypothetical protein